MSALDETLTLLDAQLKRPTKSDEPVCPKCGNILPPECRYEVMGMGTGYACLNCDFRGPLH